MGTSPPVQAAPTTMPAILPQVFGGVTVMVTPTGGTAYGVSVVKVIFAAKSPGWVTVGSAALSVTVTWTRAPGATVKLVGDSDNHGTSPEVSQSSNPGSTSLRSTALNRPVEPPIL